jgi:hypothetical protein
MNARSGVELAFTDRAAVHWVRSADGDLTEIDKAPVDHYDLHFPWSGVPRSPMTIEPDHPPDQASVVEPGTFLGAPVIWSHRRCRK